MLEGMDMSFFKGLFDKITSMPSEQLAQMLPPEAAGQIFNGTGVKIEDKSVQNQFANPWMDSGGPNAASPSANKPGPYAVPLPANGLGRNPDYFSQQPIKGLGDLLYGSGSQAVKNEPLLDTSGRSVPVDFGHGMDENGVVTGDLLGPESFPYAANPDPLKKHGAGLTAEQILALQKAMPGTQQPNLPHPGSPASARGLSNVGGIGTQAQGQKSPLPSTLSRLIYGR